MNQREINEKRYEIAASQVSIVMMVGLFSNIGIFAITAFADLSSGVQTDWIFQRMKIPNGTEMRVKLHRRFLWLSLR